MPTILRSGSLAAAATLAALSLSPALPGQERPPGEKVQLRAVPAGEVATGPRADSLAAYAALLARAAAPHPEIPAGAREILAVVPTGERAAPAWSTPELEAAEDLYLHVSRRIATLPEMGGPPRPAVEVLQAGQGDPGEKHALLVALLAAAVPELEARPAFVDDRVLTLLSLGATVGAAVEPAVGAAEIWLDPSTGLAPFGYLEPELRGREALVAEPDGTVRRHRTPALSPYGDVFDFRLSGDLSPDGTLQAHASLQARGDAEWELRRAFRQIDVEAWDYLVAALAETQGLMGAVTTSSVTDPASVLRPFRMVYAVEAPEHLFGGADAAFLPLPGPELPFPAVGASAGASGGAASARKTTAESEVEAPPFVAVRRVEIGLPPGVAARLPDDVFLEREFGHYRSRHRLLGGRLQTVQRLDIRREGLTPEQEEEWRAFQAAVREDLRRVARVEDRASPTRTGDEGRAPPAAEDRDRALSALWARADSALDRGDPRAAIPDLERYLEEVPTHVTATARLAYAYLATDRPVDAAALLEPMAAEAPFQPHVHRNLGVALERLERLEEAADAYRAHLALQPFDVEALAHLGRLLAVTGAPARAVPVLRRAAALDRKDPAIPGALADALRALDRAEEARAALEEALRRAPGDAEAGERLAWLLGEMGRWEEALAAYRAVEAPSPFSRAFHAGYAYALMRVEGRAGAEAALRRAAESRPADPLPHGALAWLLASTERSAAALPSARKAAELEPGRAAYWALLGRLEYRVSADGPAALRAFERAVELDPGILDAEPEDRALYDRLRTRGER